MADLKTGRVVPYLTEMFRFQAWVAMGKVAHPMSGEVERDLDGARAAIDLLAELETRTAGNRSDEESKLMKAVLTELRMNYVDEAKKPTGSPAEAGDSAGAGSSAGAGDSAEAGGSVEPGNSVEPGSSADEGGAGNGGEAGRADAGADPEGGPTVAFAGAGVSETGEPTNR